MNKTRGFVRVVLELALLGGLLVGLAAVIGGLRARPGVEQPGAPTPYLPPDLRLPTPTEAGRPYPPPRPTYPPVTPEPTATLEPTPTVPPVPTWLPTPVVIPIPVAKPPFIPFSAKPDLRPFTIVFRVKDEIRAINSDGSNERLLVDVHAQTSLYLTSGTACGAEEWGDASPDGRQLVLVLCDSENRMALPKGVSPQFYLYLFDTSTGVLRPLVPDGVEPVWSPDGKWIAYGGKTAGLWLVNVATGEAHEIYSVNQDNEEWVTWHAWSPDSQEIVFVQEIYHQSRAIVVVDASQDHTSKILVPASNEWPCIPRWSPDGTKILYLSEAGVSASSQHFFNLWLMHSDGTDQVQVTHDMEIDQPVWSPDSQWIAFAGLSAYENENPSYDLWLINGYKSDLERLTFTPSETESTPLWSPDGNQIIFIRELKGENEVWRMSLWDAEENQFPLINREIIILPIEP
jgi:Tol biopolymer transport system component